MKLKKIMKWSVITMAMMAGICFAPQSGKAAEKLEVKINGNEVKQGPHKGGAGGGEK